jgi:hypothetical protein
MSKKKDKKLFYYNDDENLPITSGGVIIYKFNSDGLMELLLSDTRGGFEDLGGLCEFKDKNIQSTAAREASEESNKILNKNSIKKRIKNQQPIYIKKSKYIIFIIQATPEEEKLICKDFGDKEIHDNILRKIKWLPLTEFLTPEIIKYKMNWRIKHRQIFDKLKSIKNNSSITKDMFIKVTKVTKK